MRQQLRLRVVLPVAVLALLGAGIGAYASGGGGGGSEGSEFVVTHTTEPKASAALAPAAWAGKANAICRTARLQRRAFGGAATVSRLESSLVKTVALADKADGQLAALGYPRGRRALAQDLLRAARGGTAAAGDFLAAFRRGDGTALARALRDARHFDARFERIAARLGAGDCAKDPPDLDASNLRRPSQPSDALLRILLLRHGAVVVVFYAPESLVDRAAVYEARAAALELDAGFLSVNAESNAAVTKFAEKYAVHASPAILVVAPGPKVVAKFAGFVDRKTVEQALADANR